MTEQTQLRAKRSRIATRAFGALAVLVLVLVAPGAASASNSASREASLVGSWATDIYISTQEPPTLQRMTFVFNADHQLHGYSLPGDPFLEGRGIWQVANGGTFSFWITHDGHQDPNGNPTGSINSIHLGKFNRHRFTTTAFTYIDLHIAGAPWIGPVPVRSEGRKLP